MYKIYAILKLYVTKVESINKRKVAGEHALKIYAFNCLNNRLIAHFSSFSPLPFFAPIKKYHTLAAALTHHQTHTSNHFRHAEAHRALELLEDYHSRLGGPQDRALRIAIERVIRIFKSRLFQALLGEYH